MQRQHPRVIHTPHWHLGSAAVYVLRDQRERERARERTRERERERESARARERERERERERREEKGEEIERVY